MYGKLGILIVLASTGCLGTITGMDNTEAPPNADPQAGCAIGCHGTDTSNAPPKSISGAMETTAVAVGAHQAHMNAAPTWHLKVECSDCHVVPAEVGSPGHIDGDNKAELTFSIRTGPNSTWNGTTCTTGCHGTTAWGGTNTTPTWTLVDGSQSKCGSCHGAPPPAPHPQVQNCASCHPTMEENSLTFRDPASHINGKVDLVDPSATGGCTTCHGTPTSAAPPKDLSGATTGAKVGAHQAHLKQSTWHRDIACSACHQVPIAVDTPGHIDGDNVSEVKFDTMNPAGTYAAGTCSNNYCHSNGRGNTGTKAWTATGPLPCNGCHSTDGTNQSGDHRRHANQKCSACHSTVVNAAMTIINPALHVNGVHEVKMANGTFNATTRVCSNPGCHGTETW